MRARRSKEEKTGAALGGGPGTLGLLPSAERLLQGDYDRRDNRKTFDAGCGRKVTGSECGPQIIERFCLEQETEKVISNYQIQICLLYTILKRQIFF
jgi:hypothetical protein